MEMLGMASGLNRTRRGSMEPGAPLNRNRRGSMEHSGAASQALDTGRTRRPSVEGSQAGYRAARRLSVEGTEALPPRARRLSIAANEAMQGTDGGRRPSIQGNNAIRARRNSIELSPRRIRRPSIDGAAKLPKANLSSPRRVRRASAEMSTPRSKQTIGVEVSPRGRPSPRRPNGPAGGADAKAANALGLSFLDLQRLQAQAMETEKRNAQRQNSSMQEVDNEDGTEETEALADFRMHLLDLGENEKQPDAPSEPIPAVVEILEQMRNRLQDGAESMLGTEGERKPIDKNNADKSLRNDGIVITHQKNLLGRTGGSPRATSPLGRANGQLDSPLVQQSPSAGRESVVIVTHKKSLAGRTGSGGGSDGSPVTGTLKPLGSPVGGSPINGTLKGLGSPVTGSPPNASPKDLFRQRVGLQSPTRYACLRLVELRAGKVQAELLVRMAKYKEAMDRCTRLLEHV